MASAASSERPCVVTYLAEFIDFSEFSSTRWRVASIGLSLAPATCASAPRLSFGFGRLRVMRVSLYLFVMVVVEDKEIVVAIVFKIQTHAPFTRFSALDK